MPDFLFRWTMHARNHLQASPWRFHWPIDASAKTNHTDILSVDRQLIVESANKYIQMYLYQWQRFEFSRYNENFEMSFGTFWNIMHVRFIDHFEMNGLKFGRYRLCDCLFNRSARLRRHIQWWKIALYCFTFEYIHWKITNLVKHNLEQLPSPISTLNHIILMPPPYSITNALTQITFVHLYQVQRWLACLVNCFVSQLQ